MRAVVSSIFVIVGILLRVPSAIATLARARATTRRQQSLGQQRPHERSLQTNAKTCTAENEALANTGSLGDMNSENLSEDGLFFFVNFLLEAEDFDGRSNFNELYTCDNDSCDYTELRDAMIPLCEFFGGKMYSAQGSANCFNVGVFMDVNAPLCLGPSCGLTPFLDAYANPDDCIVATNYTAEAVPYILSDACRQETRALFQVGRTEDGASLGSGDYVFSEKVNYDDFCNTTTTPGNVFTEECDFSPLYPETFTLCQNAGGYLYSYNDTYTSIQTTSDEGTRTDTSNLNNVPICVGRTCNADNFFTKVVFPAYDFALEGEFTFSTSNITVTRRATYEALGYQAILDIPTQSPVAKPTPTSSPPSTGTTSFPALPSPEETSAPSSGARKSTWGHFACVMVSVHSIVAAFLVG